MIAALLLAMMQQVPGDSARPVPTLRDINVTVSRTTNRLERVAGAVSVVSGSVMAGKPTMGLDELLSTVPGVYVANRWNFSLDQRLAIRGFGARSSFGIRGVRVLLDGIPQTLPDGSGQLTNVELGSAKSIEVLRGPAAAAYGNASGGVISIHTADGVGAATGEILRLTAGSFDRRQVPLIGSTRDRTWTKWQSTTRAHVGSGLATLSVSRFDYGGERQHSDADLRNVDLRYVNEVGPWNHVAGSLSYGDDPVADNPGALTLAELARNPDSAAAINLSKRAGKDVSQLQGGASWRHFDARWNTTTSLAVFGVSRRLRNPQTFAYIDLDRTAYGARLDINRSFGEPGARQTSLTAGLDFQRQRDDRLNVGNQNGAPDTVRQLDQLERVTELGPFVSASRDVGASTTLSAGARYDWLSFSAADRLVTASNPDDSGRRTMGAPSFSLGITHRHETVTFYANVGTSFETPTTTELANRPDTAGGFNPLLKPQKALSGEVGLRCLTSRFTCSLAVFRARVSDALIASQIPSSPGRVFYQNAGRSRHQGVELQAGARVVGGARLDVAWTWSDFRYSSYTTRGHVLDGRRLPGIPEHWVHLLWSVHPRRTWKGAWVEAEQTISSGFPVDDTLGVRNKAWHTVDLRAGYAGQVGRMQLSPFLAVNNVLDRHYVGSVVINAANGRYYEPAPGRNAYVGLTISADR
jgi:iron complex outermembrane receptor protein